MPIYDLLCFRLAEGDLSQDMTDTELLPTRIKVNGMTATFTGEYLLTILGRIYARVFFVRLHKLDERVYTESQCGFRAGRSTIDVIFSLKQLQEKCREQNLHFFFDLTKAFDSQL